MIQPLQTSNNGYQHSMIKGRHNDTWKIFSNWFSWFKTTPDFFSHNAVGALQTDSIFWIISQVISTYLCLKDKYSIGFCYGLLSYPATLVQKYILSPITSFCADIKSYLHPAKDFVISFDGLTIKLLGALWAIFHRKPQTQQVYL